MFSKLRRYSKMQLQYEKLNSCLLHNNNLARRKQKTARTYTLIAVNHLIPVNIMRYTCVDSQLSGIVELKYSQLSR